jgi:hypothetical protein
MADVMEPRLKVKLHRGWRQIDNPGALAAYVRGDSPNSGTLQFSIAQFRHGQLHSATEQTLIGLCEKLTSGVRGRMEMSRGSGKCEFGMFGTVVVKGDFPVRVQVWVVSNQREFILITHTCEKKEPDPEEVAEANDIALMTGCS